MRFHAKPEVLAFDMIEVEAQVCPWVDLAEDGRAAFPFRLIDVQGEHHAPGQLQTDRITPLE